ncbi:MAG: CHAT domain-containing protein [Cyanothece sp. SIO1E1]|nr:CHAT domain-containing protein [Cyanothece sp. SIO1E1]
MARKLSGLLKKLRRYFGLGLGVAFLTVFLWLPKSPTSAQIPEIASSGVTPSISDTTQLSTEQGSQWLEQGRQHYRQGQFADAVIAWQQAESIFAGQGDVLNQAMALSNLALAHRQLGQWPEANRAIATSLSLLNAANQGSTSDRLRILAQALNTQGSLQFVQGQAADAVETWQQAADAYQQTGNITGVTRSLINQSQALRVLGFHLRATRQLKQAREKLDEHTDPVVQAAMLRALGNAQRLIGNLEDAQKTLEESRAIARNLSSPADTTATLISLGNTAQALQQEAAALAERTNDAGDRAQAKKWQQEALTSYRQAIATAPNATTRIQAQLNQLSLLVKTDPASAKIRPLKSQIQTQLAQLSPSRATAYAQISLAHSLMALEQGHLASAAEEITQILSTAVQQARDLQDIRAESYALGYLGHLYEQLDRKAEAEDLTGAALRLVQAANEQDIAYRWQWQLGRLYTDQGNDKAALDAYQAAFENIRDLRQDLLFIESDVQFTFRDRVEPLYREYVSLLLTPDAPAPQVDTARTVIESLRLTELENFLACSVINSSRFGTLVNIDQVVDEDQQTAILYPIILPDRLELILKLPGQPELQHYTMPVTQEELQDTLKQLRYSLEQPYFSSQQGQPAATQVYHWLIRPAEEKGFLHPDQIKTLVFVLDHALRNIPMAALYDQAHQQYLVEKYAIAVSLGDLKLPQEQPAKQFKTLIAGLSKNPQDQLFGPLTYVKQEIQHIQQSLPNAKVLPDEDFTSEALQAEINTPRPYNVVHLATHGEFGFSREKTFILTAQSPAAAQEISAKETSAQEISARKISDKEINAKRVNLNQMDRLLRTRDQTPIELLVLSACETATGDDREVLGMAGTAVQAGARSTLATLWSVDDSSTAAMMQQFYQELTENRVSRAEALRRAQLHLLQTSSLYKPSHWAPYILVGDWR